jgi:thiosulfate/3-mercaptopyruvate sulfurtransferase
MNFATLITAEALATHAGNPSWRLFDCRHDLTAPDAGSQAYRAGHIPGAQFLHLDRDLSGTKTGHNGRHPLPDPSALAARLAQCGVSNHTQVVAYDDSGGMFAARLWWLLRWLGHDKVAVLDGGLASWRGAGLELTTELPRITPSVLHQRVRADTVDAAYVMSHLHQPSMLLIDARSPDRYRGENETLDPVAGHIPGAINRFFKDNLTSAACFKPAAQLRAEFDQLLRGRAVATVVAQCGSGVTACHNLLALEIAGLCGARLYPGSWSEWCSDPRRPVTAGQE